MQYSIYTLLTRFGDTINGMRVTVVGPSSGGKSTLTRKISQHFNIPRLEMDRLWFEAGGHECFVHGCTEEEKQLVQDKIRQRVTSFLKENDSWVVDGTYSKIQPAIAEEADNVVLIRRSLVKRIFSHLSRIIKGKDRHPETGLWQDVMFTKAIIRRWQQGEQAKLDEVLLPYQNKLITLRSFEEIDRYFNSLV